MVAAVVGAAAAGCVVEPSVGSEREANELGNDPRTDRGVLESSGSHLPERLLDLTIDQFSERGQGCLFGGRCSAIGGTLLPHSVDLTRRLTPELLAQKIFGKKLAMDSPVIAFLFAAGANILGQDRDSLGSFDVNKGTSVSGVTTLEAVFTNDARRLALIALEADIGIQRLRSTRAATVSELFEVLLGHRVEVRVHCANSSHVPSPSKIHARHKLRKLREVLGLFVQT